MLIDKSRQALNKIRWRDRKLINTNNKLPSLWSSIKKSDPEYAQPQRGNILIDKHRHQVKKLRRSDMKFTFNKTRRYYYIII